jgi:hypothetical protein
LSSAPSDKSGTASTAGQFDLTVVGNEDLDELAASIESFYKRDTTAKTQLSYHWERNSLMIDGRQWLVFSNNGSTGGMWERLQTTRSNDYIPRPTTNYMFDVYQTLKAYVGKTQPRSTVFPNTDTHADKEAAKIGDLCLDANWARLKEEENYEYADACLVMYGTVFKKSYWDTTELMMAKVPRMVQQPQMDPTTGAVVGMQEVPATDPLTGDPLFDEIPLGDVNTEVIEPFRVALDPNVNDIHKIRWIMEYSVQPLSWIKEVYNKDPETSPGYTGLVDDVKEESQLQGGLKRMYQLKQSSGVKTQGTGIAGVSTGADDRIINSAVVKEYYERPSRDYPNGRMVVVANGVCLYAGDSPYSGPELGDWHPYSECRWEIVPGRFWGKSPLDAAAEIQKQINAIDSVIVLNRKTMAIPQKLIPISAGIAHGSWTGRPGQEIYFRDVGGGQPPQIIKASGVDATVFQERAQRVEDMKTITGAIDILKGDRPDGITAASALEMLYEVGMGKLFPVLGRRKRFVTSDQKKQLRIISKYYKEPRPDFIRLLQQKNKELSAESISNFIGTDLLDNCNVVVEAGTNVTKLQAAKKQELREAAQSGVLNLADPRNRAEYMQQMGITGFDSDIGPDQKRAELENSQLDNLQNMPNKMPIVLQWDNDPIHIQIHEKRMKEASWMELPQATQQAYMQHWMQHQQAAQQKQLLANMQAAASGMPPQPAQPQPEHMRKQPTGKGPSHKVSDALATDTIQAAGPGGAA